MTPTISRIVRTRPPVSRRAVALWKARHYNSTLDALVDLSGHGLHARLGSAVGADSNDPLRLTYGGRKRVYLPASAGNFISTPDRPELGITGQIDLRYKLDGITLPVASESVLISRDQGTTSRSYHFTIGSGAGSLSRLVLAVSDDGTNNIYQVCSADIPAGARWGRVTFDPDNGSNAEWNYYYSLEENPTAWTKLGATLTATSISGIYDNGGALEIGSRRGGTSALLAGYATQAQVYDGIDGTLVADFDASRLTEPYATVADGISGTWTLNRSSSGRKLEVVDMPILLLGTDDYLEVADHPLLNFGAGQDFTVLLLLRRHGTPAATNAYFAKSAGTANEIGYAMYQGASVNYSAKVADGTTADVSQQNAYSNGVLSLMGMTRRNGVLYNVFDSTLSAGVPWAKDLSNSEPLRIGRFGGAGTSYADMSLVAGCVLREALSASELAQLKQEMLA